MTTDQKERALEQGDFLPQQKDQTFDRVVKEVELKAFFFDAIHYAQATNMHRQQQQHEDPHRIFNQQLTSDDLPILVTGLQQIIYEIPQLTKEGFAREVENGGDLSIVTDLPLLSGLLTKALILCTHWPAFYNKTALEDAIAYTFCHVLDLISAVEHSLIEVEDQGNSTEAHRVFLNTDFSMLRSCQRLCFLLLGQKSILENTERLAKLAPAMMRCIRALKDRRATRHVRETLITTASIVASRLMQATPTDNLCKKLTQMVDLKSALSKSDKITIKCLDSVKEFKGIIEQLSYQEDVSLAEDYLSTMPDKLSNELIDSVYKQDKAKVELIKAVFSVIIKFTPSGDFEQQEQKVFRRCSHYVLSQLQALKTRDLEAFEAQKDEMYADIMDKAAFLMQLKQNHNHSDGLELLLLDFLMDQEQKLDEFKHMFSQAVVHEPIRSVMGFTILAELINLAHGKSHQVVLECLMLPLRTKNANYLDIVPEVSKTLFESHLSGQYAKIVRSLAQTQNVDVFALARSPADLSLLAEFNLLETFHHHTGFIRQVVCRILVLGERHEIEGQLIAQLINTVNRYLVQSESQQAENNDNQSVWLCSLCCHENESNDRVCDLCQTVRQISLPTDTPVPTEQDLNESLTLLELLTSRPSSLMLCPPASITDPNLIVSILTIILNENKGRKSQVLATRLLQNFLGLDQINDDVLQSAIDIAASQPGTIRDLLCTKHALASKLGRQDKFWRTLLASSIDSDNRANTSQIVRNILESRKSKFCGLRRSYRDFIRRCLTALESLSLDQLDIVFWWMQGFTIARIQPGSIAKKGDKELTVIEINEREISAIATESLDAEIASYNIDEVELVHENQSQYTLPFLHDTDLLSHLLKVKSTISEECTQRKNSYILQGLRKEQIEILTNVKVLKPLLSSILSSDSHRNKSKCAKHAEMTHAQVFSLADAGMEWHFMTWDRQGKMVVFRYEEDHGPKAGKSFCGKLVLRPEPVDLEDKLKLSKDDQILVLESEKLRGQPSPFTMRMLKDAKILVTDSAKDLRQIAASLQTFVQANDQLYEGRAWDECFPQRFLVVNDVKAFLELKMLLAPVGTTSQQLGRPDSEHARQLPALAIQMINACQFTELVEEKFWRYTWSRSKLKQLCLKRFEPGEGWLKLVESIRANSQAQISDHRRGVIPIWDMIRRACDAMGEFDSDDVRFAAVEEEEDNEQDQNEFLLPLVPPSTDFTSIIEQRLTDQRVKEIHQQLNESQISQPRPITISKLSDGQKIIIRLLNHSPKDVLIILCEILGFSLSEYLLNLILGEIARTEDNCSGLIDLIKQESPQVAHGLVQTVLSFGHCVLTKQKVTDVVNLDYLITSSSMRNLIYDLDFVDSTTQVELFDLFIALAVSILPQEGSAQLLSSAQDILDNLQIQALNQQQGAKLFNKSLWQNLFLGDEQSQVALISETGICFAKLLIKIQDFGQRLEPSNLQHQLRLSPKLIKACKMWEIVTDGMDSPILWQDVKLQLVMRDSQAQGFAKVLSSDQYAYDNLRFKKRVETSEQQPLVISIDKNGSQQTVKVTLNNGESLYANSTRLETFKKSVVEVPIGSWADIEITESHPSVLFSGRLDFKNPLFSSSWRQLIDSSVLCEPKLISAGPDSVIFVDRDECVWAMGRGVLGKYDAGWISQLDKPPACDQIKQVVHGISFRLFLTSTGSLFIQGSNFDDILKLKPAATQADAQKGLVEIDVSSSFDELDSDDQIIHVAVGSVPKSRRNLVCVVTQKGEALLIGVDLVELLMHQCKHQRRNGTENNLCRRLNISKDDKGHLVGYQARQVFMALDRKAVWLTVEDKQGLLHTITAGEKFTGAKSPPNDCIKVFKHLENVSSSSNNGGHLTHLATTQFGMLAIDSNQDLWLWKDFPKEQLKGSLYEPQRTAQGPNYPHKMKWFREQGLNCIDIQAGHHACIIRTDDSLFGLMPEPSPSALQMLGMERQELDEQTQQQPVKLEIDNIRAKNIKAVACMNECSLLVISQPKNMMNSHQQLEESKCLLGQQDPTGKGIFYYFRDLDGWHKRKDGQEQDLPQVCFATRHPVVNFDANNDQWELNRVWQELSTLKFDDTVGEVTFTSFTDINDQEQRIVTSEEQFMQGGQSWDLNPLLFYRLGKPLIADSILPKLNLKAIYEQNRTRPSQISITIRNKNMDFVNNGLEELASLETKDLIKQLESMSAEEDRIILSTIEKKLKTRLQDARNLTLHTKQQQALIQTKQTSIQALIACDFSLSDAQYTLGASDLPPKMHSKLHLVPWRTSLLLKLNLAFYRLFKLIDHKLRFNEQTQAAKFFALRKFILPTLLFKCVKEALATVPAIEPFDDSMTTKVTIRDRPQSAESLSDSVFYQLVQELKRNCAVDEGPLALFRNHNLNKRPFEVGYQGSVVVDGGGPFRKVLCDIYEELRKGNPVGLLTEVPDGARYMLNEQLDCYNDELYVYMGALLAYSFLTMNTFGVDLADALWKLLLGHKLYASDMAEIDAETYSKVRSAHSCDPDHPCNTLDQQVNAFFEKYNKQVEAVRHGMNEVLANKLDIVAYLPLKDIKLRVCGHPTVSAANLRHIAKYEKNEQDIAETEEQMAWLWDIIEGFSDEERSKFLVFVWAQDRLPAQLRSLEFKINQQRPSEQQQSTNKWAPDSLPTANTCIFQLLIPFYTTKQRMEEQIRMAMLNADGLDDDHH